MKTIVLVSVASVLVCAGNIAWSQDYGAAVQKGVELFNKAYYEEALKEFQSAAQAPEAPDEDRIKAHYYMMKIYRAFGDNDKVKQEIAEVLSISPNYKPSSKEPASIKNSFEEIRNSMAKEKPAKEMPEVAAGFRQDIAVLERKISESAAQHDALKTQLESQKTEIDRTKFALGASVLTVLLLLAASVSFR